MSELTHDSIKNMIESESLSYQTQRISSEILNYSFKVFSSKDKRLYKETYEKLESFLKKINIWLSIDLVDDLIYLLKNSERAQKEYAYRCLYLIIKRARIPIRSRLSELVPIITIDVNSSVKEVRDYSTKCLKSLLNCNGNADLTPFIPIVMEALVKSSVINESVEKLAGCVFVQNVEAPALATISPILIKGLKERKMETQRKACVIIDNMCKLVEHPKEVVSISKKIQPLIEKCADEISDPEARNVANKALNTLKSSCQDVKEEDIIKKSQEEIGLMLIDSINNLSNDNELKMDNNIESDEWYLFTRVSMHLCNSQIFDEEIWINELKEYIPNNQKNIQEEVSKDMAKKISLLFEIKEEIFEDNEEGQDLYKGTFSLAYGALTLLNNANLHLKRNRFYGLLGLNNCGKTTLMRAIANEQVEGFPKKDELKTIFVEHEIEEREVGEDEKGFPILNIDLCGIEWVMDCCNEVYNLEPKVSRENVEKVMEDIGFGNSKKGIGLDRAADVGMGVTTYSGGWKMKMQLCAATLMNADILMLDEPTGHLDTTNIAWIKQWLKDFINNGGSIISTSHDSSFLNEMCTHLIDFQNRKLKTFKGSSGIVLKEFVDMYPEKKGYFELKNDVVKFKFPEPTPLEGVKSLSKSILRMKNVTFTYPSRDKPTIMDVSLECSRISRVAVIGANGAGKSTAIKLLIGELETEDGTIWKHPNARLAYIAQHAFHHLEKHLNKTPVQYILWRFAGNEDKENIEFLHKGDKKEELNVKKKYMVNPKEPSELKECFGEDEDKHALEPEKVTGRRDNKKDKTHDYEVKFKGKSSEHNMWVRKDILTNMGGLMMIQRQDEKEAVAAGLMSKPLTSASVEAFLGQFSIEPEQASHTLIKSLSGGQKVKVVLAASLWQNPHLVILDEPTNYLDRDGLGALTLAIQDFKGGVIIISHNKEFANAVSQEKWIMEKGRLRKEGESLGALNKDEEDNDNSKNKLIGDDIIKDSFGNEIKVEQKKNLSDKEKKSAIKKLQKKIKDGKKKKTLLEEEIWEIEAEIEKLSS